MSNKTTSARKSRGQTLNERLAGSKDFTLSGYKSAHVAHSYASQIRRRVGTSGGWAVKVNVEAKTIRVSRQR